MADLEMFRGDTPTIRATLRGGWTFVAATDTVTLTARPAYGETAVFTKTMTETDGGTDATVTLATDDTSSLTAADQDLVYDVQLVRDSGTGAGTWTLDRGTLWVKADVSHS